LEYLSAAKPGFLVPACQTSRGWSTVGGETVVCGRRNKKPIAPQSNENWERNRFEFKHQAKNYLAAGAGAAAAGAAAGFLAATRFLVLFLAGAAFLAAAFFLVDFFGAAFLAAFFLVDFLAAAFLGAAFLAAFFLVAMVWAPSVIAPWFKIWLSLWALRKKGSPPKLEKQHLKIENRTNFR
jgi:hypothetical protein